ncbi:gliding motility-associated C-terminal domain-containing protein [Chryseobacterium sp. SNU WT5]|uniref:T9SS type B sorting domain-containing protein n=1 Tax=Chryseobacterium sp. SNU WT5 TaxID=2594269 RepID=UPI00117D64FB|nr:T9SS type B sorting domain-containing protein [Chryseobacterium sp. SNU WT5]QDP86208.1 gliding motility-associated C-terminal domain-containing protein [Chryseobacterium sp. SNU WT5]
MPKIYFSLSLFIFSLGFSQSVNLFNPADQLGYPQTQYFCPAEQFDLEVDAVASSTGDYAITSVSPSDYQLGAGSIPIKFPGASSSIFSEAFPIGFNFSFYGKTYTNVVMGSNGRLVFTNDAALDNLKDKTVYKDRTFSGITGYNSYSALPSKDYNKVYQNDPLKELNLAQIFFGYTDLVDRSVNSSVTYLYNNVMIGAVKGLLVSFQNQIRTNGTGDISSVGYYSYILILEDGRIVIYVNGKNEIKYNAILGIQNEDASKFRVPEHSSKPTSDYNNGPWKSEGKAWLFTPNQKLTPVFKWTNNGNPVGTNSNTLHDFAPNDNDVLKVVVTYVDPDNGTQIGASVSDQVLFKSLQTPVITTVNSTCAQIDLETASIPDVSYEWRKVGSTTILSSTNKLSGTSSGDYVVKIIRNGSVGLCSLDSAPVSLVLNGTFPPFNDSPKFICKTDGSTQTTVDLYNYYAANPTQYSLKFQENGVDIANPTNFVIDENVKRTITIIAESLSTTSSCPFTKTFDLTFISLPLTNSEYVASDLCFGTDNYNLSNFENQYFTEKNYQFTYSIDGGMSYQTKTSVNPQLNNLVFVKIKHPDVTCESVVKLKFNFYPAIEIKPYSQFPEHCHSSTEYFDLNITKAQLEYSPDIKVTFFTDLALTNPIVNLNYRGSGKVFIKIENTATNCVADTIPELDLKIYPKPDLIKGTPETKYSQCGTTVFNLTTNINDYIGNWTRYSEIRYYDYAGNLLSQSEWENYDLSVRLQPYMVFVYNATNNLQCSDRINFQLIEYKKPVSIKSQILICAELTYAIDDFKNQVINNSSNYTFTDLSRDPLPNNFNLSSLPVTVDFLMKDNTTGCISDPQTVNFVQGGNSALDATAIDYPLCDTDFDGKTAFKLDSKKSDFTTDPAATFKYFKDASLSQSIGSTYTNEIAFAQTVYVRITIPTFCPTVAEINLKVNIPSKSTTLKDDPYFICYGETLTIDAGPENDSIVWSDGQTGRFGTFTEAGTYSVTLHNGQYGCPYTHNFTISDENQPKIKVINQTNTSIEVIAEGGAKPYKYYFNGIPQNSNVLQNPTASSYVIQVESATGCFGPPQTVYFIKINNAFTPNSDGKNDVWKIDNLDKMEQVSIVIVDRNGTKIFESTNPNKSEWDGRHNGKSLPTSTYWYVVSWYDSVTQKTDQRQGWVLLKNRD